MSYQFRDTCYLSGEAWAGAFAADFVGRLVPCPYSPSDTCIVTSASAGSGGFSVAFDAVVPGGPPGASQSGVLNTNPIPCAKLDWADALTISWAIAAAWIAAYALTFLRKATHGGGTT